MGGLKTRIHLLSPINSINSVSLLSCLAPSSLCLQSPRSLSLHKRKRANLAAMVTERQAHPTHRHLFFFRLLPWWRTAADFPKKKKKTDEDKTATLPHKKIEISMPGTPSSNPPSPSHRSTDSERNGITHVPYEPLR
uniref:Uncharacterized protein n=2 Tax=Opuntia streptacantha TaxID=393608 RepID=A0A7C9FCA8_OPUST